MGLQLDSLLTRLRGGSARLIFVAADGTAAATSFHELYEGVLQLVGRLRELGIQPGQRLGILAPSSCDWIRWDLAIMALGCISVAFPPESKSTPAAQLAERYRLQLLVVDPTWVQAAELELPYVIDVGARESGAGAKRARDPALRVDPPGTCSLVFSSGTTGKLKGLIISAAGTQRLVDLYERAFGVAARERCLTFLPFCNYQQRMTYYFCLHHGVDFVYTPHPQLFNSLRAYQPTFIIAPPMFYDALQKLASTLAARSPGLPLAAHLRNLLGGHIRYLVTGMAPSKPKTLELFWECGVSLYEAYGITEAGMVAWNKPGSVKLGTVGTPAEPSSVSLSEDGEVVVSRDALLSLGYFESSPEEARATFVGESSVATGDIGEFDGQGFLRLIGRKKDALVARSGEKFHPETIEALIQREPGVLLAVVTAYDGIPGTTAIVTVATSEDPTATERIRKHIEAINCGLPPCQQVGKTLFTQQEYTVENGMRTQNLKINRRAVHAAFSERAAAGRLTERTAPLDALAR